VDEANPTGLAQVVEEIAGGAVKTRYVYGLERIAQTQVASGTTSFYGYDGHGDVRYLTDVAGKVTDTYDYDAFGNVVGSTGTTANVYRYQGEAFDSETGLYYLRARYYDPVAGRFLSVDALADQGQHPYTYAGADPVNGHDPTGTQDFLEFTMLTAVFMPSAAVMAGMAADFKCIASLALSRLLGPAAVMVGVKGCLAMFRDTRKPGKPGPQSPGPGPGAPNDPCCGSRSASVAPGQSLAATRMNDAGIAAESMAVPMTLATNKPGPNNPSGTDYEYGGWIVKNRQGALQFTAPLRGCERAKTDQSNMIVPPGYTKVAIYHTHPDPGPWGDGFSAGDVNQANALRMPSYVGMTYSGNVRVFIPGVTPWAGTNGVTGTLIGQVAH